MLKWFNKNKKYTVTIITKNKKEYVEVLAKNKKAAIQMVEDVLLKCSIFNFKTKNDFTLKVKCINRSK